MERKGGNRCKVRVKANPLKISLKNRFKLKILGGKLPQF